MPLTPGEVPIIGELVGKLHEVKFDDQDLTNFEVFPKLAPALYLDTIHDNNGVIVVPQRWVQGLVESGLLNLLRMPHFCHYNVTDRLVC